MHCKFFRLAALIIIAAQPFATAHAAAPANVVEISQVIWTDSVDRDTRLPGPELTAAIADHQLILWMQVKGSAAAMEKLAADGKLPLRHKWFRQTLVNTEAEGVTAMIDSVDLALRGDKLLPKLQQELRANGTFDWRTWSQKDHVSPGRWRVRVAYANGEAVLCDGKPCEYIIDVKR